MTAQDLRTASQTQATAGATPTRSPSFRADVEGVRALAVLAVLLFHAHVPWIRGGFVGVDVFFVVSGYVITALLLRELSRTGRISFRRFYARRAKRLLPAATLVLVVTAVATWLLLPMPRWPSVGTDVVGAGTFVVNWVLALRATDYLGSQADPSPVQQFWSLSVEEQFYLVWPALLMLVALLAARRGWRMRRGLLGAMAVVLVPSFTYCVWATANTPASAFFSSLTRVWEMALGGVVALTAAEAARISPRVRAGLGWLGALLIGASLLLLSEATAFPGMAALVPTLGTAALLVAGLGGQVGPVSRALSLRPMVWIGGLSYSLYLWHWPVVVFAQALRPGVGWPVLVALTLGASVVAWLSFRMLENPVRHAARFERSAAAALAMGAVLVAVSVTAGLLLGRASGAGRSADLTSVPVSELGAAAMRNPDWLAKHPEPVDAYEPLVPNPVDALNDNPVSYTDGCLLRADDVEMQDCQYGDPRAAFQIAIVGDSHATAWVPALTRLAKERGFGMRALVKSMCPLTDSQVTVGQGGKTYSQCETWKQEVRQRLADDPPDLLLLSSVNYVRVLDAAGTEVDGQAREDEVRRGFRVIAEEAEARGSIPVFIADVPLMKRDGRVLNVPDCVASNLDQLSACATSREVAIDQMNPVERLLSSDAGYAWRTVDLTDALCLPQTCPAAIGHVIVYRDYAHLTQTYAETLTPWMADALEPWLP